MTGFMERLEARARVAGSLLCVGLDPHPADLGAHSAAAARDLCLRLIEATSDAAAAFKPNAAFFEALGSDGWTALAEVIAAVPDGIPVILDAKRGDIASSAEAYAVSAFDRLAADAITLSPYMGRDSLEPFLARPGRGAFLLCKTSNPAAGDLQDVPLAGARPQPLYERVAELARAWNTRNNLGLVVAATYPAAMARVRRLAPELWILAPGVGAQGGDLTATLAAGLRADGLGLLVPVSRQVARAADPRRAAQELVVAMQDAGALQPTQPPAAAPAGMPEEQACLADRLLAAGCVRFGSFTLKSGLRSPIYLDLRRLVDVPALLADVAAAYVRLLAALRFDRLAALPYAGLPIATAVSLAGGWPMIYPRREAKAYGTGAEIEGSWAAGERVVVIDDLATTGGSKLEAIDKLAAAGLLVRDVVVLIDRGSGAADTLAAAGYRLHAVMSLAQMLDHWERRNAVPAEQIASARAFVRLTGTQKDADGRR